MAPAAVAQKQYDPGATDNEIKIGNVRAYTGWASKYGATGRAEAASARGLESPPVPRTISPSSSYT
jgi:hypothetical protein